MLGVMCLVTLLQLARLFLLLSVLVFSAYRLCVLMCAMCFLLVDWRCFANVHQSTLAKHSSRRTVQNRSVNISVSFSHTCHPYIFLTLQCLKHDSEGN